MRRRPRAEVAPGERVLAIAPSPEGAVTGTRVALYLPGARIPWEQVYAADWDAEAGVLTVSEMGEWGRPRPVHRVSLEDPARLLQLLRERVTASLLLQRPFPGGRVVARRSAAGEIAWFVDFDEGVDPAHAADDAQQALAAARLEVGGS